MKKLLFVLFLLFSKNSLADLKITDFNQSVEFTEFGRNVVVKVKMKTELEKNYFYKDWKYIFDKSLKIEVYEAKAIGREYKASFGNNELVFQFDKAFNGETLEFEFRYTQFNNSKVSYVRHEHVAIPEFAKGADGNLIIKVPDNLAVYSINPDFTRNVNAYSWKGKVAADGFSDFFYLTLKRAKWKTEVLTEIVGRERFSRIDVSIPLYFKNGNNTIEDYHIKTNYDEVFTEITENKDSFNINFNKINSSMVQVKVDSIVKNDFDNKVWIKLDHNKYLNIDEKLARELQNYIYKIQSNSTKSEPLHISLARWVNSYIEYDDSFFGKDMDSREILSTARGVCMHYAVLYNDLLRAAGIPSVIVLGLSYNVEREIFENHAWNLVFANGEWVSIDPTWGLYSGRVPISHIFFNYYGVPSVSYLIYNTSDDGFKSDTKNTARFIE